MGEFDLIRAVLEELGPTSRSGETVLGPGDDAAVTAVPPNCELVSSIDTLVGDVHFPAGAPGELIGFRAMCVAFSDIAAMGARPGFGTIALTLPDDDERWVRGFARGVARAAERFGCAIVGGNLARGPLNVAVSAHGYVASGRAVRRSGAVPGESLCIGGTVGVGAAALRHAGFAKPPPLDELLALDAADPRFPLRGYFAPEPDFRLAEHLVGRAGAAIDVSDGLLADIAHLCEESDAGVVLDLDAIPCWGDPKTAVVAGDDYLLCFTLAAADVAALVQAFPSVTVIGTVVAQRGMRTADGSALPARGFDHFRGAPEP